MQTINRIFKCISLNVDRDTFEMATNYNSTYE